LGGCKDEGMAELCIMSDVWRVMASSTIS
jgi:hypothetical protein